MRGCILRIHAQDRSDGHRIWSSSAAVCTSPFPSGPLSEIDVVCSVGFGGLLVFRPRNSVAVAQDLRHVGPFLDSCSSKPTILWFDQMLAHPFPHPPPPLLPPRSFGHNTQPEREEAVVLCCVLSPQSAARSAMSHYCSVCRLKTHCLRSHYSSLVSCFFFFSLCVSLCPNMALFRGGPSPSLLLLLLFHSHLLSLLTLRLFFFCSIFPF